MNKLTVKQLEEALMILSEVISTKGNFGLSIAAPESPEDMMYYDNSSLQRKLNITERTLHRYRKNGLVKWIKFKGKIYYPKNYLVTQPIVQEPIDKDTIPINELIRRMKIQKPKSKIINIGRITHHAVKLAREHCPKQVDFREKAAFWLQMRHNRLKGRKVYYYYPLQIRFDQLPIKKKQ